jgi:hypothetical protein
MSTDSRSTLSRLGVLGALMALVTGTNDNGSTYSGVRAQVVSAVAPAAVSEVGFSVTATTSGVTLPAQSCHSVHVQNRATADDGTTALTNSVWVEVGGVKLYELLPGQDVVVMVSNANLVTLRSFAGTNLVSGGIVP